jgi:cytochrome c peroxidase
MRIRLLPMLLVCSSTFADTESSVAAVPPRPPQFPAFEAPKDSPLTPETVALGRQLFFDPALSKDKSQSCSSCHLPDKAWTSGNALDPKVGGAMNKRNTPTVLNLAFHTSFYWDGRMPTLEAVSNAAWKGQLGADPAAIATALNARPAVKASFQTAYGEDATADNIPRALASFLRALTNANSAFDKAQAGDKKAMSAPAKQGFEVFKKAGCINCHLLPLFSDLDFHNAGIGSDKPEAERDHGRKDATKKDEDEGKFKTPSLRNVALTGPYFHDGSAKTLEQAIDVMAAGGVKNPLLDAKLTPQKLTPAQKAQLKAFLESLTGTSSFNGAQ